MDDSAEITKAASIDKTQGKSARRSGPGGGLNRSSDVQHRGQDSHRDEDIYRSLIETLPEVVFTISPEGVITYLNPAFETYTGWTPEEWIGKPFIDLIGPENKSKASKMFDRLKSGETVPAFEIRILTKHKSRLQSEVSASSQFVNGEFFRILGAVRDITDRKRTQEDIIKSKFRLELTNNISAEINSSASLDSIIGNTVDRMGEFFGEFRIVYSTIDRNGMMRCVKSSQPDYMDDISGFEADLSEAPEYLGALKSKRTIVSEDVTKDGMLAHFRELLLSMETRALVDVPVFDSDGLTGLVCMDSRAPYKWTDYEIGTLQEVSENLGLAINNAQMARERLEYERALEETLGNLSRKNRNEKIISTVTKAVHQSIDLSEVMNNAVESMHNYIEGVDYVVIYVVEGNEAVLKAHRGLSGEYIEAAGTIPYGRGLIWKTILDGEPLNVPDIDLDTVVGPAGRVMGIKSCKSSPIRFEGRVVGAMNIASSRKQAFGEDEVRLLENVSKQIEVAIKNARQAEALRQSEERYRTLFDQSPVGVYIFNRDLIITSCNRRLEEMVCSTHEEVVGINLNSLDHTPVYPLLKKVINGDSASLEGFCELTKDPVKLYVYLKLSPLRDEKDDVIGGMVVVEDISDRKLVSLQAKRIRSLYEISAEPGVGIDQQLTDTLHMGCTVLGLDIGVIGHIEGKDYGIIYCYDRFDRIKRGIHLDMDKTYCGITLAADDVIALDHVGESEYKDHAGYRELGMESYIAVPLRVNGEVFGTLNFASPNPRQTPFNQADKDFIRLMGRWVSTMIERRRAEEMLGDKEELYRTLVENAHDLIIESKIDGRFVYLNSNHKNLLGYETEELLGKVMFDYIHEDDCAPVKAEFMRALMTNTAAKTVFRFRHKNGGWRWLESAGKSFETSSGESRWVIDSRDITERKRAEEQIRKSLREKESLLREIHHRVKNNLQIISSLLSLQSDYVKDTDSLRLFNESQNRISAIALIHEQLYQSEDLAEINIGDYIKNLTDNLKSVYEDGGSGVQVEIDNDDISLDIDKAIPCGLIINELFSNCLKHAFKCCGEEPRHIEVGFNVDSNGQYILSVADDGCGLPPSLDYRETETLGLQLVCTLADQLNGVIEVENEGGCAFKITFPSTGV